MESMNFRSLIGFAPGALQPVLKALCDWMDATDRRLSAIEARLHGRT
jgi:hypothetical protein